jgi:DNA-3-methyladenine glycosylase II
MFLIFTLKRPNIFPLTDLGIQKGFKIFFSMDEMPSIKFMEDESRKWEPYKTIVSLYLWLAVEGPFEW